MAPESDIIVIHVFNSLHDVEIAMLLESIQKTLEGEKKHRLSGLYSPSGRQLN